MDTRSFDEILRRTFDDGALSRSEERALRWVLRDLEPDNRERALLRSRAFALAEEWLGGVEKESRAVVAWLRKVVNVIEARREASEALEPEVLFSPGDDCLDRITGLFVAARASADVCVFTLTDDRIASAILDAHERGVRVRIVTDDEKSDDLGSDVVRLAEAGIPTVTDRSPDHMHHKFAVFDGRAVITGSYNWTRSAARGNEENLVVLYDRALVAGFSRAFDRLWTRYHGG